MFGRRRAGCPDASNIKLGGCGGGRGDQSVTSFKIFDINRLKVPREFGIREKEPCPVFCCIGPLFEAVFRGSGA